MNHLLKSRIRLLWLAGCLCLPAAPVSAADQIGLALLHTQAANINGAGVRVAQVEADLYGSAGEFEVNPSFATVAQPVQLFTYYTQSGSSGAFPNPYGTESLHADDVGELFYGMALGVATNLAHVDNYEAGDFVTLSASGIPYVYTNYTVTLPSSNIGDPLVNQSFAFEGYPTNLQTASDSAYDNYAAKYNILFVSAIDNGGPVNPPSTCYNGLGVGAYGGSSSTGPTLDNGRAKPDLVTPWDETSFSTPQVTGGAALLLQAALAGVGGADLNSATSPCALKALLINGAVKPPGWTNNSPSPLDRNYGAGIMNVLNSYEQLAGGKHGYDASATVPTGGAHPPTGASATEPVLSGWDYNTNTSSSASDAVNHYYFNVTNAPSGATFATTATLVWNRHQSQTAINHLKLYLYNTANNNLVSASVSAVDNVQHVWVPNLPAGRYDLQVWKAGGSYVSAAEPYALAYAFTAPPLTVSRTSATSATVSWPVYPAGYLLESTTNLLASGGWNTNYPAPAVNQAQNQMVVATTTNSPTFFRLVLP